ncbi:cytochrome c oxidase assembly factor 7 homolog [Galendromus occidentalis]|uniref:Cytochrome c oxidase assembly factor 7 homolog n=1 Tax=Galendromus occidentalis TaxID=34638 RepID=A0AAJ6VYN2_9ACAR|nr:cytochrome c oxidase assembly factor 7 homolog [Galendromus occidentalis]
MGINMEDEEEVRRYLENLNIEYQFSCYKENNGEGCCLLGEFMQVVREDYRKASAAFKKGCDQHNFPKACFKYGGDLFRGRGVKKDQAKALEYQKKACDLGWKEGCLVAGYQLEDLATDGDILAATEYFKRACDLNSDEGCDRASAMYHRGTGPIPRNLQKCVDYAVRACDLGHAQACANASFLYKQGIDGVPNIAKSEEYKKKALEIQMQARRNRGFQMEQGIGEPE